MTKFFYWNIILLTLLAQLCFTTSAKSWKKKFAPPLTKSWIRYWFANIRKHSQLHFYWYEEKESLIADASYTNVSER